MGIKQVGTAQAAKMLGYTIRGVRYLIHAGKLPGSYQVGRAYIIPLESVEKLKEKLEQRSAKRISRSQ